MSSAQQFRIIFFGLILVGLLAVGALTVVQLHERHEARIAEQTKTATRLGPNDQYSINQIPFEIFGTYMTFTGGSKDGTSLRFKPNGEKTKIVDATVGTRFTVHGAALEITKYDANTDIVYIKRLMKK